MYIYKFKNEYFIVCNKFWKHKNHKLVLDAYKVYKDNGGKTNLIFTGDKEDYRSKKVLKEIEQFIYKHNLNKFVKLTGRIKKSEQLILLNNSKALIQPTLFEGGPGGGSVYDAISMDKNIIISNIDVNKEIKYNKFLFFDPHNCKSLYKLLNIIEKKRLNIKNKNYFKKKKLRQQCGDFLIRAFSMK